MIAPHRFTCSIELGNLAMLNGFDVAAALAAVEVRLMEGALEGAMRDELGNTVGRWSVTYPEPEGED